MKFSVSIAGAIVAFAPVSAIAQLSGGKVVRVGNDLTERCVDPYKDKVWLTLRSLTVNKSKQWFTKDKEILVVINAKVQTDPVPPSPISFPLMTTAKLGGMPTGQISVPIEYSIVSGLALRQDKVIYSGLGAEITLVNLKDRSSLGSALQALDAITSSSKIPIPASPYIQAATYLVNFANSAVQKDIDAQKEDKAVAGSMQFTFDPNGECTAGDYERTGTKAIIFSEGDSTSSAYVDLSKVAEYCFSATLAPVFSLNAALSGGKECLSVDPKQFKAVANNYIGLYLNKQAINRTMGPAPTAERDRRESIARCKSHGIAAKSCPGAAE